MSSRKFDSGSTKRKKKSKEAAQLKKLKCTMDTYLLRGSHSSTHNTNVPECSHVISTFTDDSEGNVKQQDILTESDEFKPGNNDATNIEPRSEQYVSTSEEINRRLPDLEGTESQSRQKTPDHVNVKIVAGTVHFSNDPSLWPEKPGDKFCEYFVFNKPDQNINKISNSKQKFGEKNRSLTKEMFYRKKGNREEVLREWLVYSPLSKSLFCFVCKLFSSRSEQALCKEGLSDWVHVSERLKEHENSLVHRNAVCTYSNRSKISNRVDQQLVQEYFSEVAYWREILKRIIATIKFLSQRSLAFFGENETLHSQQNGNFLGIMELISSFDPFLATHLAKYGNPGSGHANYLSSTTVCEVIKIMAERVLKHIVDEAKRAKYFSIIVDSTPDITHVDQLSVIIRYVNEVGVPVERFVKFTDIQSHKAEYLTSTIVSVLENIGLDMKNCVGQSFDNASNMSGSYSGVQARIREISPFAEFVPCAAHTLNLVGVHTTECCQKATVFFCTVESVYDFFSSSPRRWTMLNTALQGSTNKTLSVKKLSQTRWSASANATKALRLGYPVIAETLCKMSKDENEKAAVRVHAKSLHAKLMKKETALLTIIWDTILQRINKVSTSLQSSMGNLSLVLPLYESIIDFTLNFVRKNFELFEKESNQLLGIEMDYESSRRKKIPKSRLLDDSSTPDVVFNNRDSFITQTFYVICDNLVSQLQTRKKSYEELDSRFGFVYKDDLSVSDVMEAAELLQKQYSNELEEDFAEEFLQFRMLTKKFIESTDPLICLGKLRELNLVHTFPNVDTCFRIFLTIPISNCSSERSFSVLKRTKQRLRASLKEESTDALGILSIESDVMADLSFDDIIDDFAARKVRKKPFC